MLQTSKLNKLVFIIGVVLLFLFALGSAGYHLLHYGENGLRSCFSYAIESYAGTSEEAAASALQQDSEDKAIKQIEPKVVASSMATSIEIGVAPSISAQTAILIERRSGRILYEKNPSQKIYPASTTKILTALLAIESEELDRMVTVSKEAAYVEGSSIYLAPEEEISLRDLLYGMMLRSGNDAAIAIAEEVGGTAEEFTKMMNQRVKSLGLTDTHFMNPNGLHDPEHYSTAYDMAMITREAMKNPVFKEVARAKTWVAHRKAEGAYNYFYNKNKVLYQYSGGTGVKIGYTTIAGRCLVASSEKDGMELICVVMNAPDWFNDTYQLMDYGYACYDYVQIAQGGRLLKTIPVKNGTKDQVFIAAKEDVYCPSMKGQETKISILYDVPEQVEAPVTRGQLAGELKVYSSDQYVYAQPLYYMEDIDHISNKIEK